MKIAFLTDDYPTKSTFINTQIEGLIKDGHTVYIFPRIDAPTNKIVGAVKGTENFIFYPEPYIYKRSAKYKYVIRTFFKYFTSSFRMMLNTFNYHSFKREAINMKAFFNASPFFGKEYDVILVNFGLNGNRAIFLKKLGIKAKIFTVFHGYDIRDGENKGGHIYNELFKNGDYFLSISDYNTESLKRLGLNPNKIIEHPVGIDTQRFTFRQRNITTEKIKILTIGRLVWEKGYEYGINAIKKLIYKGFNIEYTIVGEGYLDKSLIKIVEDSGIKEYVTFKGGLYGEKLVAEYDLADIFFLPSIAEALPVVIMEALYCGLPVVATDVGSIKQLVINDKTGILVPSKNADLLAKAIEKMINNSDKWLKYGMEGHKLVLKKHDNQLLNNKLVSLFQKSLQ